MASYRLRRRLAEGGMAEVFEGVAVGESGFERRVAIKRLPELADEQTRRMFLDEAHIASKLHHGNIVGVVDFGVVDGHPFQVLELVDGMDARTLVAQAREHGTPLPPVLALYIVEQVAHALHHAHHARDDDGEPLRIVHRDVKPANILLSWDGDVKLSDFGIAYALRRLERTLTGTAKGTPAFMAPEQIIGEAVDGRADVFALGCVLQALLTGASPLEGSPARLGMLSGKELDIPTSLPEDVRTIVVRATRRHARERYADADALAGALDEAIARRGGGQPRTALRRFLASLRDHAYDATLEARGELDALLGVNFEGSAVDVTSAGKRTPGRVDAEVAAEPVEPKPVDSKPSQPIPASPVRARAVIVLAALSSMCVCAWLALRPDGDAVAVAQPAVVAQDLATRRRDLSSAPPDMVALPDLAFVVGPPEPDESTREPRAHGHHAARVSSEGGATGIVAIGGDELIRAKVIVDGHEAGYAPMRLELAVGSHRMQLVPEGGAPLPTRDLVVSTHHTSSAPLVVH